MIFVECTIVGDFKKFKGKIIVEEWKTPKIITSYIKEARNILRNLERRIEEHGESKKLLVDSC